MCSRLHLRKAAPTRQLGWDGIQKTIVLVILLANPPVGYYWLLMYGTKRYSHQYIRNSPGRGLGLCQLRRIRLRRSSRSRHRAGARLHYSTLYCALEPQDEELELIVVWGARRCRRRLRTCRPDGLACNRSVLFVECSQLGLLSLAFAILYPAAWRDNLPQ